MNAFFQDNVFHILVLNDFLPEGQTLGWLASFLFAHFVCAV